MLQNSTLWRQPKVLLNILVHPFLQDPLGCFSNAPVHLLKNDQGQILSYCVLTQGKGYVHLKDVFTFKQHRGQSHATTLLNAVLSQHLHEPVYLLCPNSRISFYQRLGFEPSSTAPRRLRQLRAIGDFFTRLAAKGQVVILQKGLK